MKERPSYFVKPASSGRQPALRKIVNFIGFQVGWFACVLGAAHAMPWLGPVLVTLFFAVNVALGARFRTEGKLAVAALLIGIPFDSMFQELGLLKFAAPVGDLPISPPWLAAMWVNFGMTLHSSLSWLVGKTRLAILLGALGGPAAYLAGERLGAVTFIGERPVTLAALAVLWAVAVPALCRLAAKREDVP